MPDAASLTVFILATLALLVTPGPAVMYIVARSIHQGRLAGLVSVLGISVGALFHVGAAALGISAILLASATLFSSIKLAGAAYLIYLGIKTLFEKPKLSQAGVTPDEPLKKIFWQGVVVNVLNPKTALFFFAFLPQFVNPAGSSAALQVLLLGMLFVGLALLSDGIYALVAGTIREKLLNRPGLLKGQKYVSGGIYITLGIGTALGGIKK